MSDPLLLPWKAPDGVGALIKWISEVVQAGATKPPGAGYPYAMVRLMPGGSDDKLTYRGVYAVHVFDVARNGVSAVKNARDAADLVHRRVLAFGPPLMPQQSVVLPDGTVVMPDTVETKTATEWVQYSEDGSVEQFVTEYDISWRYQAA